MQKFPNPPWFPRIKIFNPPRITSPQRTFSSSLIWIQMSRFEFSLSFGTFSVFLWPSNIIIFAINILIEKFSGSFFKSRAYFDECHACLTWLWPTFSFGLEQTRWSNTSAHTFLSTTISSTSRYVKLKVWKELRRHVLIWQTPWLNSTVQISPTSLQKLDLLLGF